MAQKILKLTVVLLVISLTFAAKSTGKKQVVLNQAATENNKLELISTKTSDAIDQIFELIQDLQSSTQTQLDSLNENWSTQNANFDTSIQNAMNVYNQYNDDICPALNAQYQSDLQAWQAAVAQRDDAQSRTDANNQRIAQLEEKRCQYLDDYSSRLSTNKDTLKLLQFLKDAVSNFNYNNLSLLDMSKIKDLASTVVALAQKKNVQTDDKLTEILQLSSKQDQDSVHIRTAEQIGTGHIDDAGDAINVQKLDTNTVESLMLVKGKLLDLIDQLVSEMQATMEADKQSQIDFYNELSSQLLQLEAENRMLEKYLGIEWTVNIQGLFLTQFQSQQQFEDCTVEAQNYLTTVQDLQTQQQTAKEQYNAKVGDLSTQVNNFEQVKQLYQDGVAGAKDQYKQYIQDYVDDGNLDTTQQFEGRTQQSVSEWEALKNAP